MAADRTTHKLKHQELAAIECPLQLKQGHRGYESLIDRLGGPARLSRLLEAKDPNRPVELTLVKSDSNHFVRPIAGEFVTTSNILVKVIKRTRTPKPSSPSPDRGATSQTLRPQPDQPARQLYRIEPVGVIPLTVRFRALADYHYTPDLKHPINLLAQDIRSLNYEGVLKFNFEAETEDYSSSSKTALFPPPLFSRYLVPQLYQYRQNIPSVVTDTPEGYQRLVNRAKYVPLAPPSITYDQPQVPQGPSESNASLKKNADEHMYQRVQELFEQRPMWIRVAFQNQLTLRQVRLLRQNREILALSCYTFTDGPFKDLLIRFNYDPRVDPEARFCQRISLRNLDRRDDAEKFTFKLMKRPSQKGASSTVELESTYSNQRDHIFDGLELHQSVGTYQLCDITDPLLKSLINSTKGVLTQCHVRTGWYTSNAIEQIRSILRKKFHALIDEQRIVKDLECVDLLDIDVREEAVNLIKKSSVTEKRVKARDKSTATDGPEPDLDDRLPHSELDRPAHSPTDPFLLRPSPPKPLHPNPLLKYRRERNRTKAKPADKSVTFFEPGDLDGDLSMTDEPSEGRPKGGTSSNVTRPVADAAPSTSSGKMKALESRVTEDEYMDYENSDDDDGSEDLDENEEIEIDDEDDDDDGLQPADGDGSELSDLTDLDDQ